MTVRPGRARFVALLPGLVAAGIAHGACLALTSHPDGASLVRIELGTGHSTFAATYVHSVTRTPVDEQYRVDGDTIVETEIRFDQHGPGLPTEADAGAQWTRRDGRYVVTMDRRFDRIVMRVHAEQKPTLVVGDRATDLAQWGNRAIALSASASSCPVQ